MNLYTYCSNNPVMYYDPSGYKKCKGTFLEEQYRRRLNQTPSDRKGQWLGDRGESVFVPKDPKLQKLLAEYGLEGISYKDGVPDFSPFAEAGPFGDAIVKIDNMHGGKNGRSYNFSSAFEALSEKTGTSVADLKHLTNTLGYTWHECNDMRIMQLIPTVINGSFGHMGGVGEINFYFEFLEGKHNFK